jgi:ribosomal protein S14
LKKEDIKININVNTMGGLTSEQLATMQQMIRETAGWPNKQNPTESAKKLKDAIRQSGYDQCHKCGGRQFRVEKILISTSTQTLNMKDGAIVPRNKLEEEYPEEFHGKNSSAKQQGKSRYFCESCGTYREAI